MKNFLLIILFTISLISKSQCQENSYQVNPAIFSQADDYLKKMMNSLEIVGLNYAILIDNKVVHQQAFGLANVQLQVPMTIEHSFPVASISKLFSSVALHQLLKTHNRSVNETVEEFLPDRKDLPESWRKLTLKQLLSHTSGIPDQIDYQIYLAPESEKAVINALRDKPFSSEPGTESKYNATGFLLVRIIIEKLADQNFESYMQEHFFDKLGLHSAQYGGFKKIVPNRVTCYQKVNDELEMFPLNYSPPMYAGAGLNITINDLIKWFQAIQNEQILTTEQLENIWTPVKLNNGEDGGFGLGWEAYKLPDNYRIVGHGGAGISSFRHYWNEQNSQNVTVILLTNGALNWSILPNQINLQIASMILAD
ncbi:serine hydrolase domain-containing protein [Maribellus maritimus]|uniref:serine hydrolase domain-containing protein n=1 Tax=Maribellus maritimus TaxID=2870838 RepID=UPI001EEB4508|nr:serine hydrolase domain-containing protein [Maribellus maritimus]MCG6190023.1 beta-lactamase family protein [Maribellus maritimus]